MLLAVSIHHVTADAIVSSALKNISVAADAIPQFEYLKNIIQSAEAFPGKAKPMPASPTCSKCQATVNPTDKFCNKCGTVELAQVLILCTVFALTGLIFVDPAASCFFLSGMVMMKFLWCHKDTCPRAGLLCTPIQNRHRPTNKALAGAAATKSQTGKTS